MDSTSEILVYRSRDRCGSERQVDQKSLYRADEATVPHTWDTVDRENQVIVCIPHTPDPVLFGIRGEDPVWVSLARNMVRSELAEREAVFETNQGTDAIFFWDLLDSLKKEDPTLFSGWLPNSR